MINVNAWFYKSGSPFVQAFIF